MYRTFMRMALMLVLFMAGLGANAQSIGISVKMDTDKSYDNGSAISSMSATATYTVTLSGVDELTSIEEQTYKITGPAGFTAESGNLSIDLTTKTATVKTSSALTVSGDYTFETSVKYNGGTTALTGSLKKTINIYDPQIDATSQTSYEVFAGNKAYKTLAAEAKGGETSCWSFSWTRNGSAISGAAAASYTLTDADTKSASGANPDTYTLVAKYVVNGVSWLEKNIDYKVTVKPTPNVVYTPDVANYEAYYGDAKAKKASFSVSEDNYTSGWTVEWKNGTATSAAATYEVAATAAPQTITAVVTNTCADDKWTSAEKKFTLTGYKYPTVSVDKPSVETHSYASVKDIYAVIYITASHADGKDGDSNWTFTWKDADSSFTGGGSSINTMNLAAGTHHLTAEFVNKLSPNAESFSVPVTVTVYDASVTTTPSDVSKTIYSYVGKDLEFGVNHQNGKSWTYEWYDVKGGSKKLDITSEHYNAKDFSAGEYSFTENAIDNLADHKYETFKTFNLTILDAPDLQRVSKQDTICSNTDNVTLTVKYAGGYENGWTFVWKKNGVVQSGYNKSSISFSAENTAATDQTDVWVCEATNKYSDVNTNWSVTLTQSFNVTVHPQNRVVAVGSTSKSCYDTDAVNLNVTKQIVVGGEAGTWTSAWYRINADGTKVLLKSEDDVNSYSFNAVNKTRQNIVETYMIEAVNTVGGKAYPSTSVRFTVTILATPQVDGFYINDSKVELTDNKIDVDVYDGQRLKMRIATSGGDTWNYVWKDNGKDVTDMAILYRDSLVRTFENTTADTITHTYTVVAVALDPQGRTENNRNYPTAGAYSFKVTVYPKAKASDIVYNFYANGASHVLSATSQVSGGYPGGWVYNWYNSSSYLGRGENYTITSSKSTTADKSTRTYRVDATNSHDGTEWDKVSANYEVNFWSTGYVDANQSYDANCYAGVSKTITLQHQGGYDAGWYYKWYEGSSLKQYGNSDSYTFTPVMTNPGAATGESHTFKVNYKNSLDGVDGLAATDFSYSLVYWPEPTASAKLEITDENRNVTGEKFIRSGNTIKMSADTQYGYAPGWSYTWTVDGKAYTTKEYENPVSIGSSSNVKTSKDVVVTANMTNNFADGKTPWKTWQYSETIRVYNKPETPATLSKMGTGATCTMAVTIPKVSDSDLKNREYYLLFGRDTDNGGTELLYAMNQAGDEGTRRWCTFTNSSIFNNTANSKLWVCSVWDYTDDDVQITSGKRYADGNVDENWDGSGSINLTGLTTRSVSDIDSYVTGIEGISADNASADVMAIYTLSGKAVPTLQKGVNIVRMRDGSVRKVLVK